MILKLTTKQSAKVRRLARRECCNCVDGNCLLLDDGEECKCVQLVSRYQRMMQKYEKEQRDLTAEVENAKAELQSADQKTVDLRLLLKTVREITEVKELTSGLIHSLIERIEVHNNDKYDGHCHVKVDIYFSVIGMMDIPDEKEIQAMMEEVKKNPQKYRYVA